MSKIRFETGQVVNFDGIPTPQDIEEVAQKLGITKPQQQQNRQKSFWEKAGGLVDNTLGRASNFMFGSTAKNVGSVIGSGAEAAKELVTGKPSKRKFTDIAESRFTMEKPLSTLGNIAGTALEGTVAGFGEKTIANVGTQLMRPLVRRAAKIYQSALKPSQALLKKSPAVVKTGLDEGIRVSKGGAVKLKGIMDDIGEEIGKVIDSGVADNKSIAKDKLLPYLDEIREYLGQSLGGKQLVKEVDDLAKTIINDLPETLNVRLAQEFKKNTQGLVSKYYDKMAPVAIETKKQLARGLKEEIAKAVPQIRSLNARDSKLFGLDEALEKALGRIGNKNLIGLGDLFALGSGGATAGIPGAGLVLLGKKVLFSPASKSQFAIYLHKLSGVGAKAIQTGSYPLAISAARLLELFNQEDEELP